MPRSATAGTLPDPGRVSAAAAVGTTRSTLGQTRQAGARRYSSPHLQALYSDGGQGRDPQQELWQRHQGQVHATATSTQDAHGAHAPAAPTLPSEPIEQISFLITGIARGGDGWAAPLTPYRVDCLLSADPVRGWLVDDIATESVTFPATPAAGGSR